MPSWNSREELVLHILTYQRQGMTRRAIARVLGVSRNTVRKILERHALDQETPQSALPPPPARVPRETLVTAFAGRIVALLARYPDITAQRVFEELRADGYTGGYTAIKEHVRRVRPAPKPEPSLETPTWGPGEMAENDWTPHTIAFTHAPRSLVQVFSYVLRHSTRKNFMIYEEANLFALMDGHVATFTRFDGLAAQCKYDNQKPVVLHWEGGQPVYNPRFLAFAAHYGFRPVACRPRKPNEKPRVERSFWTLERSFLNGRSFRDLADMRAQLRVWQDEISDLRVDRKRRHPTMDLFLEEAPHLLPLPRHPYDTARVVYRVCSVDGFIAWGGDRYAVPYEAIYDLLPVRVTQHELFVYAPDLRLLVRHEIAPRRVGTVGPRDIRPPGIHRTPERARTEDLDQLRATFTDLGDGASDFFAGLSRLGARLCGFHARQILLLRERYAAEDIAAALRHAHGFGAYEQLSVTRILGARAVPRSLAEYVADQSAARIEEQLGRAETRPRDLGEYDRLPIVPPPHCKEDPCPESPTSPATTPSNESDDTSRSSG
jgi:transposase